MPQYATIRLGVLVERRAIRNRWERWTWRALAVIPALAERSPWDKLYEEGPSTIYYATTLPLTLHADEVAQYEHNLRGERPSIYAVSHRVAAAAEEPPIRPVHLTACPDEAQACSEGADHTVDPVPLPAWVAGWVGAFVDEHPVAATVMGRRRGGSVHFEAGRSGRRGPVVTPRFYRAPRSHD